jgi:hypothetical protein
MKNVDVRVRYSLAIGCICIGLVLKLPLNGQSQIEASGLKSNIQLEADLAYRSSYVEFKPFFMKEQDQVSHNFQMQWMLDEISLSLCNDIYLPLIISKRNQYLISSRRYAEILVVPEKADDVLYIWVPPNMPDAQLHILDEAGRLWHKAHLEISQAEVAIHTLPAGRYSLYLFDEVRLCRGDFLKL